MSKLSHLALAGILGTNGLHAEKPQSPKIAYILQTTKQKTLDLLKLPPDQTYDTYGADIYKMLQYLEKLPKKELQKELRNFPIVSLLSARNHQLEAMKKSLEERYREIDKRRKDTSLDEDAIDELRDDIEALNEDYTIFDTWKIQQLYFKMKYRDLHGPKAKQQGSQKPETTFQEATDAIQKRSDERLKKFQDWQDELDNPLKEPLKA